MKRRLPTRTVWAEAFLYLTVALLLLCAGGLALQQSGATQAGERVHDAPGDPGGVASTNHAALDGAALLASGEALDSNEPLPLNSEHLNTLALGLFLVSLGLLLGSGLVGRGSKQRLLELLRLPSVLPLAPATSPLSLLEVFRL